MGCPGSCSQPSVGRGGAKGPLWGFGTLARRPSAPRRRGPSGGVVAPLGAPSGASAGGAQAARFTDTIPSSTRTARARARSPFGLRLRSPMSPNAIAWAVKQPAQLHPAAERQWRGGPHTHDSVGLLPTPPTPSHPDPPRALCSPDRVSNCRHVTAARRADRGRRSPAQEGEGGLRELHIISSTVPPFPASAGLHVGSGVCNCSEADTSFAEMIEHSSTRRPSQRKRGAPGVQRRPAARARHGARRRPSLRASRPARGGTDPSGFPNHVGTARATATESVSMSAARWPRREYAKAAAPPKPSISGLQLLPLHAAAARSGAPAARGVGNPVGREARRAGLPRQGLSKAL